MKMSHVGNTEENILLKEIEVYTLLHSFSKLQYNIYNSRYTFKSCIHKYCDIPAHFQIYAMLKMMLRKSNSSTLWVNCASVSMKYPFPTVMVPVRAMTPRL